MPTHCEAKNYATPNLAAVGSDLRKVFVFDCIDTAFINSVKNGKRENKHK